MTEDLFQNGYGSSSVQEQLSGLDMLTSFAEDARMRAEGLIRASSRESDFDWDAGPGFEERLAEIGKSPWAIDCEALDRINAGLAAFRGRIRTLESRVEQGHEIVNYLAHQSILAGSHARGKPAERSSAARHGLFGQENDARLPDSSPLVKEPDLTLSPSQASRREWLANVLTVAAVLAIVLIALVLISTVF